MAVVQGAMVSVTAHGPEMNLVHPPRPADPKVPWVQEWAVKARYVSRAGGLAGLDMPAMGAATDEPGARPRCTPRAGEQAGRRGGGMLGGGLGRALGGAIGGAMGQNASENCEK